MNYTKRRDETMMFVNDTADFLTVQSGKPSAESILPTTLTSLEESKLYLTDLKAWLLNYFT